MTAVNYLLREIEDLRRNWVWFLILGVVLILLGMAAIGSATLATVATMLVFGWLLMAGGVLQIVHAFWARRWGGFVLQLLVGLLQFVVGVMVANHPLAAGGALTLLMAAFFVVGGIVRLAAAVALPFDGRVWLFLSGLITLLMGLLIWAEWPSSAMWVIGLFVGVDLLIHGWWLVMLAVAVKSMPTTTIPG
jgi:uncharacterized membrane protein HdeD (DUF308 family)